MFLMYLEGPIHGVGGWGGGGAGGILCYLGLSLSGLLEFNIMQYGCTCRHSNTPEFLFTALSFNFTDLK